MEKLDRLGWATGMSFVAHGLRIGIRTNDPQALEELPQRFPPGWRPASSTIVDRLYSLTVGGDGARSGVRRYNLLYVGPVRIGRSMSLNEVLDRLEQDLQLYVAEWSRRKLFIHAGVVAWEGRAIVIPGRSFSGKSRLVEALVRAGATYFSDEYAVFDAHGFVHPYDVPLSLRNEAGQPPEKVRVGMPSRRAALKPLPVGVIAVAKYRPGARWRPRPLPPGQAVLSLLANTVAARRKPEQVLTRLTRIVEGTRVLRGSRGEAAETVGPLLAAVGS